MDRSRFKQCPTCKQWFSRKDILRSPDILPLGMSVSPDNPELGMLFFQHDVLECGTSFTIPIEEFFPLIEEPIPRQILTPPTCSVFCTHLEDLHACHMDCRYAPVRRLVLDLV